MTVSVEHKIFSTPGSTGVTTHSFDDVNLLPVLLIFFSSGVVSGSKDSTVDEAIMSIGFGTKNSTDNGSGVGSGQYAACNFMDHGVGTTVCNNRHDDTKVITEIDAAGTVVAAASLKSVTTGSFDLYWSVKPGAATEWHVWAVAGLDDAVVGSIHAQSPNFNEASIGFSGGGLPAAVCFLSAANDSNALDPPSTRTDNVAGLSMGWMVRKVIGGALQGTKTHISEDGVTASNCASVGSNPTSCYRSAAVKGGVPAGTTELRWSQWLDDGWNLAPLDVAETNHYIAYLAIKGGNWDVQEITPPLSTGTVAYTTNDGFAPLGCLTMNAHGAGTPGGGMMSVGYGAASNNSGTDEGAICIHDDSGADPTDTGRRYTDDSVVVVHDQAGALSREANVDSWQSNGLTFDWTTVSNILDRETILIMVGGDVELSEFALTKKSYAYVA